VKLGDDYGVANQEKHINTARYEFEERNQIRDAKIVVYEEVSQREKRNVPMTSLTRRELLIGSAAIVAAGALPGAAFAAEAAEHSGFSMDTNIKGERSMTTITTKDGTMIYYKDWVVGAYMDASGLNHGFIFNDRHFRSVDDPEGVGTTTINGVNDRGQIVGFYADTSGNTDGFVGY
jgi:hypothetical protein